MNVSNSKIINTQDTSFTWPIITNELRQIVLSQMDISLSIYNRSGIFEEFEEKFRQYHNAKYALLFNSGTSAIHGMLEGLNLDFEDEIICPAYTFFATCSPALYLGYKLVFCDVDLNGNIDPLKITELINIKTKVLLITHMWGNPCQMDAIMEIVENNNLALLEDCSHAHGGEYKGKKLGTFGKAGAWSLQGQKIITGGEGGIMVTNDDELYYRANLLGHYNKRCRDEIPKDH
jgi:perosamine synthetase